MSLAPDLPAAMLAQLRATPSVVSAFAEDTSAPSTTKFWADFAPSGVVLPWATYEELDASEEFMTSANGHTASIETGKIRWVIAGQGRKAVRTLGTMIEGVLTDASLAFSDGQLMEFRFAGSSFAPPGEILPGVPSGAVRVVMFEYMLSRTT